MKKITTFLMVTGILFSSFSICIAVHPISVSAWTNGDGGSGYSAYADNATNYNYEYHFATHDWIALAALDILISSDASYWGWLNSRKLIYLVGTEAPDNSDVEMVLDGNVISGFGDTTWHHIYFNQDGTISNNEDDSALRAKSMGDLANARFDEEKLDQTAFYLGAMTHYISDMSMYSHVAENNVPPYNLDFDLYHSNVEGYVRTRTNEDDNMEDFFQISSISIGSKTPYNAAKDLAWDTYNDSSNNYEHNAAWLHNNYFSPWVQTYAARAGDTPTHQEYYNRIETSLNNAIKACVDAITYEVGSGNPVNNNDDDDDDDDDEKGGEAIPGFNIRIILGILTIVSLIFIKRYQK